jgi:hypothetical protein
LVSKNANARVNDAAPSPTSCRKIVNEQRYSQIAFAGLAGEPNPTVGMGEGEFGQPSARTNRINVLTEECGPTRWVCWHLPLLRAELISQSVQGTQVFLWLLMDGVKTTNLAMKWFRTALLDHNIAPVPAPVPIWVPATLGLALFAGLASAQGCFGICNDFSQPCLNLSVLCEAQ